MFFYDLLKYMPQILIIFAVIIAIAIASFGNFLNSGRNSSNQKTQNSSAQTEQQNSQNKGTAKTTKITKLHSSFSIDTLIKYGPLDKEIFNDTNVVLFEFGAKVSPPETKGQISYETKVEGLDKDWQPTNSTERTIELPKKVGEYAFSVRAKINDVIDPTPDKRTFTIYVSPHFKQVIISSVKPPTTLTPSLLSLSSQLNPQEKINITGWQIKGKNGIFTIPQGAEKYDSLNPLSKEDIMIKAGDRIRVSGNPSPLGIGETNFRPNKCLGYLADSNNFTIPILQNCPQPRTDRLPRYLSQNCQEYVKNRSSCESKPYEKLKQSGIFDDPNCLNYIESNFNYSSCFSAYSLDSDFASSEWHIYINRFGRGPEIMNEKNDTIYLLDKEGLPVDRFSY